MKWRLQEGDGEAIYEIGVEDNGMFVGLTREELDSSLNTLNVMASKLGAHTTLLRRHVVENVNSGPARQVAEVLVRRVPDHQQVNIVLWLMILRVTSTCAYLIEQISTNLCVLLENTPLVKFVWNYIWDLSGVFSISSLVKILMTSFPAFSWLFVQIVGKKMVSNRFVYILIKKIKWWLEDMNFIFSV